MKRLVLSAGILLFPWQELFAEQVRVTINKKTVYQSEVLKIQLIQKSTAPFSVNFLGRKHESFLMGRRQTVLLGIDYQLKLGTYSITGVLKEADNFYFPIYYKITVREKFPKLKYVPPKRSEKEQARINKETEEKRAVLERIDYQPDSMGHFARPVHPAVVNANFGEKRCRDRTLWRRFNCRYHLGIDYRAAFDFFHQRPEPIRAINNGRVVLTESRIVDGKTVVIDHGYGISSEYLHLSKFSVKIGEIVKRGQIIGIAGKTGATEAIHLHLTIKMDNGKTIVDPESFFQAVSK
ncbi:MAG: M23 family metallopeptidase [Candidatus Harrisonbacteria bacterium]|nr:M23 family metallopeptidase [Candidatus Harrisonbacteria bacterium]